MRVPDGTNPVLSDATSIARSRKHSNIQNSKLEVAVNLGLAVNVGSASGRPVHSSTCECR